MAGAAALIAEPIRELRLFHCLAPVEIAPSGGSLWAA
jgi:hypothetical protein